MKRLWKTQLTAEGATPKKALANLFKDEYAVLINGAIYIRPVHADAIETWAIPEWERQPVGWKVQTEVTVDVELADRDD